MAPFLLGSQDQIISLYLVGDHGVFRKLVNCKGREEAAAYSIVMQLARNQAMVFLESQCLHGTTRGAWAWLLKDSQGKEMLVSSEQGQVWVATESVDPT